MASGLDDRRAVYFTYKSTVERLLALAEPPDVPDGDALARLDEAAGELARAAGFLRHYLPERADVQLKASQSKYKSGWYGAMEGRYIVVWPDGEIYGSKPYVQKPAAVRAFERAAKRNTGMRLWDDRLGKFILGEPGG